MRLIDEGSVEALAGSRPADTLIVWAWRDGVLVVPEPLQVKSWSFTDEAGDAVKVGQKISLVVGDPDGTLGAWKFDDPLGVAGTRLQVIYRVGGAAAVNYGWFRITSNQPDEMVDWRVINEYGYDEPDAVLGPHKRRVPIVTNVVRLEAVDLTLDVDRDRFENPVSPEPGATVLSEVARLTAPHFPLVVDAGVVDQPVSRFTVWDRERLEAVQDVLALAVARYRMGGDGELHVYPRSSEPVWTIEPAKSLVSVSRRQTADRLYNRWVVEGKQADDGSPIRTALSLDSGPLRWGGPHGREPFFYTSEMITTYGHAIDYAYQLRDQFLASLAIELTVETIPWPQGQAGDRVLVGCPVTAGYVAYFPGDVTSISRSGNPVPDQTTLKVACSYADVIAALPRTDWAQYLTDSMPPLTWDLMPGTWGNSPSLTWDELP